MVGKGTFVETMAEGSKFGSSAQKKKRKEKAHSEVDKAVESEGLKVHRPEFFHRGQTMLASASTPVGQHIIFYIE